VAPLGYTAFGSGVSTEMCGSGAGAGGHAGGYTAFGSGVSTEISSEKFLNFLFIHKVHSLRLRGEH